MTAQVKEATEQQQFLSFLLAGEEYGIRILKVKEIVEFDTITKLPEAPRYVRGVINLRGNVVPVVDLAVKFGLPETAVTRLTCIVIVELNNNGDRTVMGVMADSVSQVVELSAEDIEPPPAFGTQVRVEYLTGMGKAGKKFVLLLDMDRVLSSTELLNVSQVQQSASNLSAQETPVEAGA